MRSRDPSARSDDSGALSRRDCLRGAAGLAALGASFALVGPGGAFAAACERTPEQILGPFYPEEWDRGGPDPDALATADLTRVPGVSLQARGERIRIEGRVTGPDCQPVPGAIVEIWQADVYGRYHHRRDRDNARPADPGFRGAARVRARRDGTYTFETIVPGTYEAGPGWTRPAHVHFRARASGFVEVTTQMYFAGGRYQREDPILQELSPEEQRRVVVSFPSGVGHFDLGLARAG